MSRRVFDASRILEGAANESPLLISVPSGGRHMLLSLLTMGEWESKWRYDDDSRLSDEDWDVVRAVAAGCVRAFEDGENVDELADAVRELARSHTINLNGGGGGGCGCGQGESSDTFMDAGDYVTSRDAGRYGPIVDAVRSAVPDSFTDDGSAFPPEFADRAAYETAKCLVANQLYRDFRATMISLEAINLGFVLVSINALITALLGTSGMVAGLVAVGLSVPLAVGIIVGLMLTLIVAGVALGVVFYEIGQELNQETFVCAMFEAPNASAAQTALLAEFEGALDRAIASGAITLAEAFEGEILQIIAIMAPKESMEALFSLAGAGAEFAASQIGDYDCANCGGEDLSEGQQLLQNPNFETDLSFWTQDPPGSWTWEASAHSGSIGRGRISSGSGGSMEQHFDVTQQMIDDGWDLRFQTLVRGSTTGSSVVFRVYDETDTIVMDKTLTAGSDKNFSHNTITEAIPLTVGSWSVRTFVGNDDVIEWTNVYLTKVP
jgi:hypothetical protein